MRCEAGGSGHRMGYADGLSKVETEDVKCIPKKFSSECYQWQQKKLPRHSQYLCSGSGLLVGIHRAAIWATLSHAASSHSRACTLPLWHSRHDPHRSEGVRLKQAGDWQQAKHHSDTASLFDPIHSMPRFFVITESTRPIQMTT